MGSGIYSTSVETMERGGPHGCSGEGGARTRALKPLQSPVKSTSFCPKSRVVVCSCPYHLPKHKKQVVREELTAMFNMGLIEESHNDWSCPVVLFPRADGSVRFCSDFTNVNMVSKFDAYPMPHTDELLSLSDMARFYSKLELKRDIGSLDSHTS